MQQQHHQIELRPMTYRRTAALWMVGGITWLAAGALGSGLHGWRFDAAEAAWITADLLLLGGLFGLRRLQAHRESRLGGLGLAVAIIGRLLFIVAELVSVAQRTDENVLLPIAALLSAAGMVAYGVAVVRAAGWQGPSRFGPLAMGLYPFIVMFPLVAANNGKPSIPAISVWGVVAAGAVGGAILAAGTSDRPLPSRRRPVTVN